MLTVGEMMTMELVTVEKNDPLRLVISLMAAKNVGAVLVVEDHHCHGIFTERDFLRAMARTEDEHELLAVPVVDVMTPTPDIAHAGDLYIDACRQMAHGGYRHLPVLDEHSAPVGILSVKDLLVSQVFYFDEMVADRLIPPKERLLKVVHISASHNSRLARCLESLDVDVLEVGDGNAARLALDKMPAAMVVVDYDCQDPHTIKLLREVGTASRYKHVHRVVELPENGHAHAQAKAIPGDDYVPPDLSPGEVVAHLKLGYRLGCVQYRRRHPTLDGH